MAAYQMFQKHLTQEIRSFWQNLGQKISEHFCSSYKTYKKKEQKSQTSLHAIKLGIALIFKMFWALPISMEKALPPF